MGAILILIAYYLVSNKKVTSDVKLYQAFNLLGAVALVVNTIVKGAIPASFLNIVWALIALKGLLKSN